MHGDSVMTELERTMKMGLAVNARTTRKACHRGRNPCSHRKAIQAPDAMAAAKASYNGICQGAANFQYAASMMGKAEGMTRKSGTPGMAKLENPRPRIRLLARSRYWGPSSTFCRPGRKSMDVKKTAHPAKKRNIRQRIG